MLQSRWSQNTFIALIAIVLVALCWWGTTNGIKAARSKMILKNAAAITEAFEHFKKDQNRYPTATEFESNDIMRGYISNFPSPEFLTATCQKNFQYVNPTAKSYELRVCLPKGAKGFRGGWNVYRKQL